MKLIDAIKSKRPYKRPHHVSWLTDQEPYFTTSDILADDWIVQSEKREWEVVGQYQGQDLLYFGVKGPKLMEGEKVTLVEVKK